MGRGGPKGYRNQAKSGARAVVERRRQQARRTASERGRVARQERPQSTRRPR